MYQIESEDLLPRAAPKPNPIGHADAQLKPTVPEVSLLFGQQQSLNQQSSSNDSIQQKRQTYVNWKRQALPRVTFPATLETELGPQSTSSSCGISAASNTNTVQSSVSGKYNMTPCAGSFRTTALVEALPNLVTMPDTPVTDVTNVKNDGFIDTLEQYRRSYAHRFSSTPTDSLSSGGILTSRSAPLLDQCRPVDIIRVPDILTICAGTQTEPVTNSPQSATIFKHNADHLATKEDVQELYNLVHQMREEQINLLRYCESLLTLNQQITPPPNEKIILYKNIGTQCEILASNNAPSNSKRCTVEESATSQQRDHRSPVAAYNQLKANVAFQSPRAPPAAQSTAYRANTPQTKHLPMAASNVATVLPKPNTEKSLVMNELALKYLPREKLAELLQELRTSPATNNHNPIQLPTTPLRPIENYDKSPSDISNASYKYLKKYRLLADGQQHIEYSSPVRASPVQQQAQQRGNSPLVGEHYRESPSSARNMLNLENIRNQPKLL